MKKVFFLLWAGFYHLEISAKEISPIDVYEHSHHSVVILEKLDDKGITFQVLTAIAVANDRVATLCDAINGSHELQISANKKLIKATVTARDSKRNLCLLSVPDAKLASFETANASLTVQSGARVFALSNALGLGVGISEGIISGIRSQFGMDYIQFSAPISPGSDGGALVDSEGRLLGIISYRHRDGQNVNFAIPAKWLAEIEQHDKSDTAYKQFRENAKQLERQGLWQKLAEHAEQWISLQQDDADAWRWAALAADKSGNLEKEERVWRKLRELEPTSTIAGAGLVRVMLKRKLGSEALKLAHELLSLRQEDAEIWAIIGQTEQASGTAEKAEEAYRKALSIDPWQIIAYQGLISIAEQRNDRGTVTQLWQRLAALNPDSQNIQFGLIDAYIREGRPERAYSLREKLVVPQDQKAAATFWKGKTLLALGRPVDAIHAFLDSLQENPTDKGLVYASLGQCYFQLQRFPESIQAYRVAIRLEPTNDDWQYELAKSLKDGGRAQEAMEIDVQLLKKYPQNPTIWRQKGFAEVMLGHHLASIKPLEKSLELDPKQGDVWSVLIDSYRLAGRNNDARNAYEKLRGIDSEFADKAYRSAILPFEEDHP
jgi:tetratricopeptide (TPR) repeat protein